MNLTSALKSTKSTKNENKTLILKNSEMNNVLVVMAISTMKFTHSASFIKGESFFFSNIGLSLSKNNLKIKLLFYKLIYSN